MLKRFLTNLKLTMLFLFNSGKLNQRKSPITNPTMEFVIVDSPTRKANMSNFTINDIVTINSPDHKTWHGKRGTIRKIKDNDGFVTAVVDNNGNNTLIELTAAQMVKVIRDPALTKLINETLPELTNQAKTEYNQNQDKIAETTNREIEVYKAGLADGHVQGFKEGYVIGYKAACDDINALMVKNGLIRRKPGDEDGNINV